MERKRNDGYFCSKKKINVAIATWEWGSYFDPKLKLEGIKLNISSWRRPSPNSFHGILRQQVLYDLHFI